nr:MAG: hypothetical protein TU35_05205 [Thermoproteus sp. AZ2]
MRIAPTRLALVTLVGAATGLALAAFLKILLLIEALYAPVATLPGALGEGGPVRFAWGPLYFLAPPLALIGVMASYVVKRALGVAAFGVDAASRAYYGEGELGLRELLVGLTASPILLGLGGSAGPEGPAAAIGASIAGLANRRVKWRELYAAGMAAGIGGIFRAPIGGAVFAAEVLNKWGLLPYALTASLASYAVFSSLTGFSPLFGAVALAVSPPAVLGAALTGVVAGVAGAAFSSLIKAAREYAGAPALAVAGAITGAATPIFPTVLGAGYGWAQALLLGAAVFPSIMPLWLYLAASAAAKIALTSLTVGAGAPGGVVAPAVVFGSFIGGSMALLLRLPIAPLALAGAAGALASSLKTPVASALICAELAASPIALIYTAPAALMAYAVRRGLRA